MKIGILTYHRSHNYGALLQAIALRRHLENQGHSAYYINYWPLYHKRMYKPVPSLYEPGLGITQRIKGIINDLSLLPLKYRRISKFNNFISEHISPYCCDMSDSLDCIICGSDQIWRKQKGLGGEYNPIYFGKGNFSASHFISYAGSMGEPNISEKDAMVLRHLFENFDAVSVREENLANKLIEQGIVEHPTVVADPTILLGRGAWQEFIADQPRNIKEEYMLYYKLAYDSFIDSDIQKFAQKRNLKLVVLEGSIRREDYFNNFLTNSDPKEMLNLIANASYVFTSSYHGLIFSLIFGRQVFCAFSGNSSRAESMLAFLDIKDRLIKKGTKIPDTLIDYSKVSPKLENIAIESREWLNANLPK